MTSRKSPVHDDDVGQSFSVNQKRQISVGLSPRWVQYSGVSPIARTIAELLADLAVGGSRCNVPLDLELIAYFADLGRADKVMPYLTELEQIGFLTIHDGGIDPVSGKRRQMRDASGRPAGYRFDVDVEAPAGYSGAKCLDDVYAEFLFDRSNAEQAAKDAGRRVRAGNLTVRRVSVGRFEKPQVSGDTGIRGHGAAADTEFRGHAEKPQVSGDTGIRGHGAAADTEFRGHAEKPQVSGDTGIRGHSSDQIDLSPAGREIEKIEPVPGGTAKPPATGKDVAAAELRAVIGRFGWEKWASQQRMPKVELGTTEVRQLRLAMAAAMTQHGLTLEQVEMVGKAALKAAKSNPVSFVVGAFAASRIDGYLEDEPMEFVADTPLNSAADSAVALVVAKLPQSPAALEIERLLGEGEAGAERADQILGTREWRAPERGKTGAYEYVQDVVPAAARAFIQARSDALIAALSVADA